MKESFLHKAVSAVYTSVQSQRFNRILISIRLTQCRGFISLGLTITFVDCLYQCRKCISCGRQVWYATRAGSKPCAKILLLTTLLRFVDHVSVKRHEKVDVCCPEPYPDVTFTFYITNFLLSAHLCRITPLESGEKVNLKIPFCSLVLSSCSSLARLCRLPTYLLLPTELGLRYIFTLANTYYHKLMIFCTMHLNITLLPLVSLKN